MQANVPRFKIAKKLSCGRTKTTTIIKNAIAPAWEEKLVIQCKTGPFSFGCDKSNDINQQKTLAIVIKYFVSQVAKKFSGIIPADKISKVEVEYEEFQITPEADLPKYIKNEGRLDEYWGQVNLMTNKVTKDPRFPLLSRLATAMLTIRNSNTDCERVFSMVRKIQKDYWSDMDNSTLCSLLCAKINAKETCYQFQPSKALPRAAKCATVTIRNTQLEVRTNQKT